MIYSYDDVVIFCTSVTTPSGELRDPSANGGEFDDIDHSGGGRFPGQKTTVASKGKSVTTYIPNNKKKANIRRPVGGWGPIDFIRHYFTGNGQAVTLWDIGLSNDFERSDSVRQVTMGFMENVLINPGNYEKNSISDVTFESAGLFSIGDSSINMKSICSSNSCTFKFSIRDHFKDPADIFDWSSGESELPGGKRFEINHDWGGRKETAI